MRRLLKFKMSDEGILVKYENENKSGGTDVITVETGEKPLKELGDALNAMADHVTAICELPSSMTAELTIRGVTLTYTHEVQGLVITALRELHNSNAPMIINTPHFTRAPYNEESESDIGIFSFSCAEAIDELAAAVFRFVDGQRQQKELDFNAVPQEESIEPRILEFAK